MARRNMVEVRLLKTIPALSLVVAGLLSGCSSGAPTSPDTTNVDESLSLPALCGRASDHACASDRVCVPVLSRACPAEHHGGICLKRPSHCSHAKDPVCGCDGNTYGNLCEAARAGQTMVHRGSCEPTACSDACPGAGTCVGGTRAHGNPPPWLGFGLPWDHSGRWHGGHPSGHSPAKGAAGGTCECPTTQACGQGQEWNDDPAVCACEKAPNPCAGLACKAGDQCVVQSDGTAACHHDPCLGVACKAGDVCVAQADGSTACKTDSCTGMACKAGDVCAVGADGSAACEPDPCNGVDCEGGLSCVALPDGNAGCE